MQSGIFGTQIGDQVNGLDASLTEDRGEAREVLGPDTPAGQAFIVAAIAFGVLYVASPIPAKGVIARSGAVLQTVAFVTAASFVGQYLARTWAIRHPNAPLAMGVVHDA